MSLRFRTLGVLIFALVATACIPPSPRAQKEENAAAKAAHYKGLLGKSLTDEAVVEFAASNRCSSAAPYILCREAGTALWIDTNRTVKGVFLYVNRSAGYIPFEDDFTPYKGELPYGLKFYDTMGAVEYKLNRQGIGNDGLPDSGSTPDHMHYVAFYEEAGITIIYNSPKDEDALIHAILVRK